MTVTLEGHQLFHHHRAKLGHSPHVVTSEVDQHDVLGNFFRVFTQLACKAAVVFIVAATLACTRNGSAHHFAIHELHHWFWRASYDAEFWLTHKVHVRAGVHLPQYAIHVVWVGT